MLAVSSTIVSGRAGSLVTRMTWRNSSPRRSGPVSYTHLDVYKRQLFGGESFFQNTYQAPPDGGRLAVAPPLPGDLMVLELRDETLLVQSGSFVAAAMTITTDTQWSGAKTFFAGEGLIMLRAQGSGPLLLSSYGAIHEMNLAAGETVTIDTGHIVAFTANLGFQVRKIGGIKSTLFSGEGLVVDLTGPGRVLAQTLSLIHI